jgi:hypothetical protein
MLVGLETPTSGRMVIGGHEAGMADSLSFGTSGLRGLASDLVGDEAATAVFNNVRRLILLPPFDRPAMHTAMTASEAVIAGPDPMRGGNTLGITPQFWYIKHGH